MTAKAASNPSSMIDYRMLQLLDKVEGHRSKELFKEL